MLVVLFLILTLVCMIPVSIALFYCISGIRLIVIGNREKIRRKKVSGYNAVFISLVALGGIFFGWLWLCRILLGWEL
jgi:hypothetical protein